MSQLQQLDFTGVLSWLQGLLGQRVIVIVADAHELLQGLQPEPTARFSGVLCRAHNAWQIEDAFDHDETLFLVGSGTGRGDSTSWFALQPDAFIGAHRNDERNDITIVNGAIALVVSSVTDEEE